GIGELLHLQKLGDEIRILCRHAAPSNIKRRSLRARGADGCQVFRISALGTSIAIERRRALVILLSQVAPERVEPLVAPAAGDVEPVLQRVLLVVILVIVLRRVELARLRDRREDRLAEGLLLLPLRLGRLGEALLLLRVVEDLGT